MSGYTIRQIYIFCEGKHLYIGKMHLLIYINYLHRRNDMQLNLINIIHKNISLQKKDIYIYSKKIIKYKILMCL